MMKKILKLKQEHTWLLLVQKIVGKTTKKKEKCVFESCQMNIGWKWTKEGWCRCNNIRCDGKQKL